MTGAGAPVTATTEAVENRSTGPSAVISSPGAPSGLPTARFASASETGSNGPLGGTPTCQYPSRPGTSCTVVMVPGETTSMRGAGSSVSSSVDVECVAVRSSMSSVSARSRPMFVTMPSIRDPSSASPRRSSASSRVSPVAMTLASSGS